MKKNNKKGFTLVELVIVVAVMAVLVAVAIPTVGSITGKAKEAVADSNARTIESVLKLAEANASAESETADDDGVATLSDEDAAQAIADAKLGLDSTTKFVYNTKTGAVKVAESAGANEWLIEFAGDDAGTVKVNNKAKTPAVAAGGAGGGT